MVLTTIADPVVLENYCSNFEMHGHLGQVAVYVSPDRKTPAVAHQRCEALRQRGMHILLPDLGEQELYLRKIGFPPQLIPYNSDNRRNIGYLMALGDGNDFVISIDDDNYSNELGCIWLLEDLLQWLPEQSLKGKTYSDAYTLLSHLLEESLFRFQGFIWTDATRAYFNQMAFCTRKWAEVCRRIVPS